MYWQIPALYILYTYVKGSTGKHAVANTVVVYAYNMQYPCTVYVHVCTLYVHVYAMYVHVLTSCLNSHSEGVYRRYIPVCTQWQIPPQQHFIYLCIQYVVLMYSVCTCIYTICTHICNAMYIHILTRCVNHWPQRAHAKRPDMLFQ